MNFKITKKKVVQINILNQPCGEGPAPRLPSLAFSVSIPSTVANLMGKNMVSSHFKLYFSVKRSFFLCVCWGTVFENLLWNTNSHPLPTLLLGCSSSTHQLVSSPCMLIAIHCYMLQILPPSLLLRFPCSVSA